MIGLLKIVSWTAPSSILEAPGLDFGGSGDDFSKLSQFFWHVASETFLQSSSDLSHVG